MALSISSQRRVRRPAFAGVSGGVRTRAAMRVPLERETHRSVATAIDGGLAYTSSRPPSRPTWVIPPSSTRLRTRCTVCARKSSRVHRVNLPPAQRRAWNRNEIIDSGAGLWESQQASFGPKSTGVWAHSERCTLYHKEDSRRRYDTPVLSTPTLHCPSRWCYRP